MEMSSDAFEDGYGSVDWMLKLLYQALMLLQVKDVVSDGMKE